MKTRLLIFNLLVALLPQAGKGQSEFEYGARVGASVTSFAADNRSLGGNLGLIGGAMAFYNLNSSFQLIGNLDYHQLRGGTQYASAYRGQITSTSNVFTLHTGELAALAAYRIPIPFLGTSMPKIVGGGSVAYNFYTQDNRTLSFGTPQVSATNRDIVTDSFSRWLYSVQGGLQFEFQLADASFSAVVIDFRYRRNINPLLDGFSLLNKGNASDIFSNSFIMTFGVKLK